MLSWRASCSELDLSLLSSSVGKWLTNRLTEPIRPAEAVLEWFQTRDEVIVMLLVSANADSQHVSYKLRANYLEVKERGISLIQADLPFPVQVEDSNWQFGKDLAAIAMHTCCMLPASIVQSKLESLHPRESHMWHHLSKMNLWHLLTSVCFGSCRWVPGTEGYISHTPESQRWFWICGLAPLQNISVVYDSVAIICSCPAVSFCLLDTHLVSMTGAWGRVLWFPELAVYLYSLKLHHVQRQGDSCDLHLRLQDAIVVCCQAEANCHRINQESD